MKMAVFGRLGSPAGCMQCMCMLEEALAAKRGRGCVPLLRRVNG